MIAEQPRQGGDSVKAVGEIMTPGPLVLGPEATAVDAARAMRDINIGSVLVVDGGVPVGIVSLGDLAIEQDHGSVLADISAAAPDRL